MKLTLTIIQIIISVALVTLIFMQSKGINDSQSLSDIPTEKRGWEKVTFNLTIFLIVCFLISSIIQAQI